MYFSLLTLLVFLLILSVYFSIPMIFDLIKGEEIINQVLQKNITNSTNPDDVALSIMNYESSNFVSPYSFIQSQNFFFKYFGIVEINGKKAIFIRNSPPSWIIITKLANCGEYAKVFVYLMKKRGFEAWIIKAPGEDHAWVEYWSDGFNITLDPSQNKVIIDKRKFSREFGGNWSYIIKCDFNGNLEFNCIDASDEYIDRGTICIKLYNKNKVASNYQIDIYSKYLTEISPEIYKEPLRVTTNITNKNGVSCFKLGEKMYLTKIIQSYLLFDKIYETNITVKKDSLTFYEINLEELNYKVRGDYFLFTIVLIFASLATLKLREKLKRTII